jgi:hypothetical protein
MRSQFLCTFELISMAPFTPPARSVETPKAVASKPRHASRAKRVSPATFTAPDGTLLPRKRGRPSNADLALRAAALAAANGAGAE